MVLLGHRSVSVLSATIELKQFGAVEARRAHNPEVLRSKRRIANSTILFVSAYKITISVYQFLFFLVHNCDTKTVARTIWCGHLVKFASYTHFNMSFRSHRCWQSPINVVGFRFSCSFSLHCISTPRGRIHVDSPPPTWARHAKAKACS